MSGCLGASGSPQNADPPARAAAEWQFRLLAESLPQIVWRSEPDGACSWLNSRWADYTGLSNQETRGEGWRAAVHPEDVPALVAAWSQGRQAGEPFEFEYRLRGRDGRYRWFLGRAEPMLGERGEVVQWFGTATDIDSRKTREDQLRRSEARLGRLLREREEQLELALARAQMGTWEWEIATGRLTWSPGLELQFGYAPGEFPGKVEAFEQRIHPDDRERVHQAIRDALEDRREYETEFRVIGLDGTVRWASTRATVHRDDAGRPIRMVGVDMDITDRKRLEAALLRPGSHGYPPLVYLLDLSSRRPLRVSQTQAMLLGYTAEEMDALGPDIVAALMHPEDQRGFASHLERLRRGSHQQNLWFDYRMRHRDGTWHWFRSCDTVFRRGASGEPEQLLGCAVPLGDVAELAALEREEELLRQRGEQFRMLLDQAPLGVCLVDADFRLVHVNPVALPAVEEIPDLIGRDFGEVLSILWPAPVAQETERIFRRTLETGEPHHTPELAAVRADRGVTEYYDWRVHRTTLPDGRNAVVCYFTGISEQVAARQAIAASEEHYRTLFTSIDEGFCVIEMIFDDHDRPVNYRFIEINPAFERQTGLRDALGKTVRELVPGLEDYWFETYGSVALTGEPVRFINHVQGIDQRWFEVYAFRLGAPESRRVALLFSDITERRCAEEALRMADQRKDEFLAMLAHELRNPLAPIRTAVRILEMQGPADARQQEQRRIIDRQVANMARLLDDLLNVSRLTRGTVLLQREPLDLGRVVQETLDACQTMLRERDQDLGLRLPDGPVLVYADRVRVEQVVMNLVTNASRYSEPGSRITVRVAQENEEAVIRVQDTGRGISPELLPHLFDLFFQAERGISRTEGGLGIGLTMVRSLVEMHGGRVEAFSDGPGRGSEFVVRLPLAPDAPLPDRASETPSVSPSAGTAPGRLRVLVVDDVPDNAQTLAELLDLWGHDAQAVFSGPRALEVVAQFSPHVVFLDLGMPEMDGFTVARALRQRYPHLVLVALTGYGQERDRQRTREAGFDHHLTKPVDPDDVQQLLAHHASVALE